MKALLKFNLDDANDKRAHLCAIKADDLAMAIWEFQHNFRRNMEYLIESSEVDKFGAMELILTRLDEIFEGIDTDTLVI